MRNNAFLNYLPNNKPRTGDQKLSDTFTTCGFPELTGSRRAGKLLTKLMGCVEDRGCSGGSFHRVFFFLRTGVFWCIGYNRRSGRDAFRRFDVMLFYGFRQPKGP